MNPRRWAFLVMCAYLAGCVFAPHGWSSKEAIERLANEKVPIGSSKQVAEAFFRAAGVKWIEFPNSRATKTRKCLSGSAHIKMSWPVTTSVGVTFYLGSDEKVESIAISESLTGP